MDLFYFTHRSKKALVGQKKIALADNLTSFRRLNTLQAETEKTDPASI